MDPHSIDRLDPDSGLERAKMKKKNAAKRQIIRHKRNQCNWYYGKMFVTLFSLKFNTIFLC
jgi:hypothetical protein